MEKIVNILIIVIIILQLGCKKEPPKNPEFYRIKISDEVKSYLWSKPGSYWIYKNTKTNELDTQVCTSFRYDSITTMGTEKYSKHITILYDRLFKYSTSTFNKWLIYDNTGRNTPDDMDFNNGRTILDRNVGGEGIIVPFFHHFSTEGGSGTGSSFTRFIEIIPTLTLHSKTYYDVVKFEIDQDDIWYPDEYSGPIENKYPKVHFYWAKDVGLIKRHNLKENYSWELIDYNIIN